MERRGQCRCGSVLHFEKGTHGYKMRCPTCGSVVRLRLSKRRSVRPVQPPKHIEARSQPDAVLRIKSGADTDPGSALPSERSPGFEPATALHPGGTRTVRCDVCHATVPAQASQCPQCGTALALTTVAPILEKHSSPAPVPPSSSRPMLGWLTAGVALVVVAGIVLLFFVWH